LLRYLGRISRIRNTPISIYGTGNTVSEANLHRCPWYMAKVPSMQKIMLDTNQYDRLLDAPETYDKLLELQSEGKIKLLATHIQKDEILAIDNLSRRRRLEALLAHACLIGTRGAILDVSRFDLAKFGDDKDRALIEHIRGDAWERESEDALIVATAAKDADIFVTDDRPLTRRLKRYPSLRCEVIDFEEFRRQLSRIAV